MKFLTKVLIIVVLLMPVMLGQKKSAAAENQDGKANATTPKRGADPTKEYGEALETPNQRRRRLAGELPQVPSREEYPFTETIEALHGSASPIPAAKRAPLPSATAASKRKIDSSKESSAKMDVAKQSPAKENAIPSSTGKDAIEVSNRWKETRDTPAEGKDGRVVFADGAGLPTVVCAPLRLCIIELQIGEKLTGEPQIGDSVRWSIEPASYGSGELTTPMIVLKPKAVGLDTNLVITTDRRAYYVRLMSSLTDYVAKVSFDYPDETRVKWSRAVNTFGGPRVEEPLPVVGSLEKLNSNYRINGDKSIRPIMVLDDGIHTYIRMNGAILHREAPVLAVLGPDGKAEMVNYRVQGSVYVVDRLFDRARLILGSGRKARKADMIRGSVKNRKLFARDPFRGLPYGDNDEGRVQ